MTSARCGHVHERLAEDEAGQCEGKCPGGFFPEFCDGHKDEEDQCGGLHAKDGSAPN